MDKLNTKDWKDEDWINHGFKISSVFTPASPIDEDDLFAGRSAQVDKVVDAINQRGQHVVIYGERGVGKTSLANILESKIETTGGDQPIVAKVTCNSLESYGAVWQAVFRDLPLVHEKRKPGFNNETTITRAEMLPTDTEEVVPNLVCDAIATAIGAYEKHLFYIILDEFDRVPNGRLKRAMADTLKTISDRALRVTVIVVGVAGTVSDLIAEHQSIERSITQVQMPRMGKEELFEIIDNGTRRLGMEMAQEAKSLVAMLSRGLPSYTHRLAGQAAQQSIKAKRLEITEADVGSAMQDVVYDTGESLRRAYQEAVASRQPSSLFEPVLLACALAQAEDDSGCFTEPSVRKAMGMVQPRRSDNASYAKQLRKLSEDERGSVLIQEGRPGLYRYRFKNPLMQPYVFTRGLVSGKVDLKELLD